MKTRKRLAVAGLAGALAIGLAAVAVAAPDRAELSIPVSSVDTDGDGFISGAELRQMMREMRARRGGHHAARGGDKGVNGKRFARRGHRGMSAQRFAAMRAQRFARLDANNDGAISREEAADTRLARRFDRIDADGDGLITRDEMAAKRGKGKRGHGKRGKWRRGSRGFGPAHGAVPAPEAAPIPEDEI
jgi:hypothetical protein